MEKKKHRGRFQAQGGGLEASESWAQDEPLTAEDGLHLLHQLKLKIPRKEAKKRKKLFEKAENYIQRGKRAGGLDPQKKTFKLKETDVRVDLEIQAGKAFITVLVLIIVLYWLFKQAI